jgi:hypothetical protein
MPKYPHLDMDNITESPHKHDLFDGTMCIMDLSPEMTKINFVVTICIVYVVPLVFITLMYVYIFIAIYRHANNQMAVSVR